MRYLPCTLVGWILCASAISAEEKSDSAGGYEDNSRWYGKVAEISETQPLQPVTTLLGLLFGALAVVVKARIAGDLWPDPITEPEETEEQPQERDKRRKTVRPGCALEDHRPSGQVRTLGQVLKDLRLDTDAALATSLQPHNGP
jgi:hypothetical protein